MRDLNRQPPRMAWFPQARLFGSGRCAHVEPRIAPGIGMIVSAASLFFRDVKHIVEILLTFGIFFTPVFYNVTMLGRKGKWLLLNPVAPILDGFRACVVRHQSPELFWSAYSAVFGLVAFVSGYVLFKYVEPFFAEVI